MSRRNRKNRKLKQQPIKPDYNDYPVTYDDYEQGAILADDEKREEEEEELGGDTFGNSYTCEMTDDSDECEKVELTLSDKFYLIFITTLSLAIPLMLFPLLVLSIYIKVLKWLEIDIEKEVKKEVKYLKGKRYFLNKIKNLPL